MTVQKLVIKSYEQDLFNYIGVTSWVDLCECVIFCSFVLLFFSFAILLPLILFIILFIVPLIM